VDSPNEIDDWVDAGCVSRGVPYVRGGMWVTEGLVWSVDPGASACRACVRPDGDPDAAGRGEDGEQAAMRLYREKERVNRGIGPVAGLLGAMCAFEVLRYLTRFQPPAYAGRPMIVDFVHGCATRQGDPWPRRPDCRVCPASLPPGPSTLPEGGDVT
jgi:molybdopterin/thiamine biosynthesis adenylyltransferase